MKVLHVQTARVIWLVDSADLNPDGLNTFSAMDAIRERYNFQISPQKIEQMNEYGKDGVVYQIGSFPYQGSEYRINKVVLYGDGLVVETGLSTDLGEAFLHDALSFVSTSFGLNYSPEMIHTKIFTSELIVHSDRDMAKLFAPLAKITEKLASYTGHKFYPAGFGISIDPTETQSKPAPFRFEWELNKSFKRRRFYSAAPVTTKQHIELLEDLECAL